MDRWPGRVNLPMFDAIAEGLEADASIVEVILTDFVLVEPSTVSVMETLR